MKRGGHIKRIKGMFPVLLKFLDFTTKYYWKILTAVFIVIILSGLLSKYTKVPLAFTVFLLPIMFILGVTALVRKSIRKLLNHQNSILELFLGYTGAVFGLILMFSLLYLYSSSLGLGYLTYGQCHDNFSASSITNDPNVTHSLFSNFYFSSITFFTVGYGDICPMGLDKIIAVTNSFVGHAFTAIIMVFALAGFAMSKKD
ncbi:MAG: ion channel [Candidatus Woesearchaeota archaeon]|jgi:potassium channel LctB